MTAYSKFPGYVDIESHSPWGIHHMQLKTKVWNPTSLVGTMGSFENWSSVPCDGEAMVDDMVAKLKPFFTADYTFDSAIIYTLSEVGAAAIPQVGKVYGEVGTNVSTAQAKAAQHTWTFRDTGWNVARITLLDAPLANGFEPESDISGVAPALALVGAFTSLSWAWASLADLRPATFRKIVYDLNDGLRRQYRMT